MALKPCQGCRNVVDTTAKTCPACGRPNPAGSQVHAGLWVVFAIVGVFFMVQVGRSGCGASTPTAAIPASDEPRARQAEPAPAVVVTAEVLYREYDDNEVAADAKYRGRPLMVNGTVQEIRKGPLDGVIVELVTANRFMGARAHLADGQERAASGLRKRQPISLFCPKGARRSIGVPVMDDCVIR